MAITPNSFLVASNKTIELTSAINNAYWSVVSGGGSFSAGSTSFKKVYNPGAVGSVSVKASSAYWNQLQSGLTLDANQNLISNGSALFAWSNARIQSVGDSFKFIVTQDFLNAGAQFFIHTTNDTGTVTYGVWINGSYYRQGSAFSYSPALAVGDELSFEITSATTVAMKRNGTTLQTITHSQTNFLAGFYTGSIPSGNTILKPIFNGATGITQETATGTVYAPLAITTTTPLPDAIINQTYPNKINTSGGYGAVSLTVFSGDLPPGLSLNSDGNWSGTGTTLGTYNFVAQAMDGAGGTTFKSFTLAVKNPPPPPPIITTVSPLAYAQTGKSYSAQLEKTSGSGSGNWSLAVAGNLPNGALSASGLITIPTVGSANYSFTARFTDADGDFVDKAFTIPVSALAVWTFDYDIPLERKYTKTVRVFTPREGNRQTRIDSHTKLKLEIKSSYLKGYVNLKDVVAFWEENYPDKNFLFFDKISNSYITAWISSDLSAQERRGEGDFALTIEQI